MEIREKNNFYYKNRCFKVIKMLKKKLNCRCTKIILGETPHKNVRVYAVVYIIDYKYF